MPAYVDYVDLSVAAGPLRSIGFLVFDPRPCDELKVLRVLCSVLEIVCLDELLIASSLTVALDCCLCVVALG